MSTDKGMDKEDVVVTYNGILLSHKKKITPFAATLINPEIIILSKVSQTTKRQISYHTIYM